MRYTHLGVGHSAMLRKVVRDCSESVTVARSNVMNDEDLDEVVSDAEGFDECDNDQEVSEEECDHDSDDALDSESSDDDVGDNHDDSDDVEGYEDAADEEFDDLSF